jgi:hypothetical protein
VPRRVREQQRGLRQLAALLEEIRHDARVVLTVALVAAEHVDDEAGVPVGAAADLAHGAQQHDAGVREAGDVVREQPGEHVEHQAATGGRGQRALPPPRALRIFLVGEVIGPRLGHHAVRVEDAGIGPQQVDVPRERRELGEPGELGQRPGGVEQGPARTHPQRLVDDQAREERLARAQPAHDGGEAGRAAHLLGQPRVPRDRAAGGGARLADHDAAPIAHARRGGGHGGRRPRDRAATAVGRGRERLAGDELARVAVLRLGVLDLDLGAVEIQHLLGPRERLGLVLARDGDAPPAVQPGVELGEPARELVFDLQHPVGLAGQRHRRVEIVVVRVVPDLRADLAHLPLQLARHLLRLADVDARRPLHGERQPIGVLHPRVVDLGDAQAVHQPQRQDGDVARHRLRPQPPHDPHRGRVGLLVHVDAVGERRQVLGLPAVDRPGHHRERARRGQPQRARAVHEPGEVVGARGDGVETAARDQHVEVAHLGGERGQLGPHRGGRELAQHR